MTRGRMGVAELVPRLLEFLLVLFVATRLLPEPLGGMVLLLFGAYGFWGGFQVYRRRQVVLDTPTAKAGAVAIGPAELSGRVGQCVGLGAASVAPFSGKPCAYWRADVWELRRDDRRERWVHVLREESLAEAFTIEDETGEVAVLPRGAELVLDADGGYWANRADASSTLSQAGRAFLEARGYAVGDGSARRGAPLKIRELRIEVGGAAYVLGTVSEARDARLPSFGTGAPIVHVHASGEVGHDEMFAGSGGPALADMVTTQLEAFERWATRAGWSSPRSESTGPGADSGPRADGDPVADRARGPAPSAPKAAPLPTGIRPEQVVLWRGDAGHPFVISNRAEGSVTHDLGLRMQLGLVLGPVSMLWGVWKLLGGVGR